MLSALKYDILLNIKNLPGPTTSKKIVVFECDDWGGIRMPSKKVYEKLLAAGIPVNDNVFDQFDTLADRSDLELLFEVLMSVKDKNGNHAVMTPVANVANPDFQKIRESGFTQYYYEPFTETLRRYERDPETLNTWKKGIELGIFMPEFHGREHLAVQSWLKELRNNNILVRKAFDLQYAAVQLKDIHPALNAFRTEFYFDNADQIGFIKDSIHDGIGLFKEIFGYTPLTLVPPNAIFHPAFELPAAESGIRYLFVNHMSQVPQKDGELRYKYYRNGRRSEFGLIYYTRNCAFEPTDLDYRGIDLTIKQIEASFRWGKPAMISSHRVNFVGGMNEKHREVGLRELKLLLHEIVRRWPDVKFMSSGDALKTLNTRN